MRDLARPGGRKCWYMDSFYNSEGFMRSEIDDGDQIFFEQDKPHAASDFFGQNSKFIIDEYGNCTFGEHSYCEEKLFFISSKARSYRNKLDGRGLEIYSDGSIKIGFFKNGSYAPGN